MKFNQVTSLALIALLAGSTALAAAPGTVTPLPQSEDSGFRQGNDTDQNGNDGYQDGEEWKQEEQGGEEFPEEDGWEQDDQEQEDIRDDRPRDRKRDDGYGRNRPRPGNPHHPGYGHGRRSHTEMVPVRQFIYGINRIPLYMLTNSLPRLEGYRLVSITINGYSQGGMGGAFFCSSQCSYIQPVGGYPASYPVQTLGEPLSYYSGNWFLELRGNFYIDSLQLEFRR